jgi:hypothetical protein
VKVLLLLKIMVAAACSGPPPSGLLQGISYIFRADFHRELPARGLLFRMRKRLVWLCLGLLHLFLTDPYLWFSELPNLPPPWFLLTRPPYSTMVWAGAGGPGARAKKTTIRAVTNNLFTRPSSLANSPGAPPL